MQEPTFTPAELRTLLEFHKTYGRPEAPDSAPAPAEQEPEPMQHYSFTYTDGAGATMPAADAARFDPEPRPASSYPAMVAMRETIAQLIDERDGNEWRLIDLQTQQEEIERLIDMKRDEYAAGLQQATTGYQMALQTASQAAAVSAALLAEKDAQIARLSESASEAAARAIAAAQEAATDAAGIAWLDAIKIMDRLIAAGFGQAAPAPAEPAASLPAMIEMKQIIDSMSLRRRITLNRGELDGMISRLEDQRAELERLIDGRSAAPAEPAASTLTPEAWIANRQINAVLNRYAVTAEPDPDNAGAVAIFHDDGFLMLLSPAIGALDLDRIFAMWKETGFNHYKEGKTDGAKEIRRDLRRALGLED